MRTRIHRSGITPEVALQIVNRRKWPMLFVLILVGSAAFTAVRALPNVYESTATILIERQQIPTELVRSTVTSALETRLQTISREILSRDRLAELVEKYDLYSGLRAKAPMEVVIQRMRDDIELEFSSGDGYASNTVSFTIAYRGGDPAVVAGVANELAAFYIQQNLRVREQQAAGTAEFLGSQLQDMQRELEEMEERVTRFKASYIGELPHQQEANLSALEQLNIRLQINSENQIRVSQRLAQLQEKLSLLESAPSTVQAGGGRLLELRRELAALEKQYSDRYPDVRRLKEEIATLEAELAKDTDELLPESRSADREIEVLRREIEASQVELETLRAESDRINESIASFQVRVEAAPTREQQYQILMRDYETTSELYRSLLLRHKEAELAESMELRQRGEMFRILEPALAASLPSAPSREKLLLAGLFLAVAFSGAVGFLLETLDTSFDSVDDLRAGCPLPILVSIPPIVTPADRRRQRYRMGLAAGSGVVALFLVVWGAHTVAAGNEALVALLMR